MSGKISHHDYYIAVARTAGISIPNDMIESIKNSKDEHFNDIPLKEWDMLAINSRHSLNQALKMHGDTGFTLACGVCSFKALAEEIRSK